MPPFSKFLGDQNLPPGHSTTLRPRELILVPSVATRARIHAEFQARCQAESISKSPFFNKLAPEVRNMIYQQLLQMTTIFLRVGDQKPLETPQGIVAFLCANRTCHNELKPLILNLFDLATFDMDWEVVFALALGFAEYKHRRHSMMALKERSSTRMQSIQVSDPYAFPSANDDYRGFDVAEFGHLQQLRSLRVVVNINVGVANVDGSFELEIIPGIAASKRGFNSPRKFADFLEEAWADLVAPGIGLRDRIKSIAVKARRRSSIMEPSMYYDVKCGLYTVEEVEQNYETA